MKKKYTAALAFATALALMLSACAGHTGSSQPAASSSVSSGTASASQSQTESFRAEPIDFTWKPVVYSDYQRQGRSPEAEKFYRDCIDAMMKGETTVPCEKEETSWDMLPILQSNFPVVNGIGAGFEYRDGAVHISYSVSDAEREEIIAEFGRKIEEHMEKAVCKGDTPTMAAIALYHSFVSGLNYDDEALKNENETMNVTPYRALMTGEGICQSFGPAYAYLCMQLGINAVEAGGLDANSDNAHSWMMMELNGHHYFADPTFENSQGGGGLRYFGQNSEQRALDNYLFDDIGLGFNLMKANEFDVSDDSFAPLWDVQNIYEICRTADGMEIRGHIPFPAQRTIPIEDGKRLLITPCDSDGNPLDNGDSSISDSHSEEPSVPESDLYAPIPESMQGTAWSAAGFDMAFVSPSTVWVDSKEYTGLGQCWLSAEGQLTLEIPDEELEIHRENDKRIILKGKYGEFPATQTSGDEYIRLFEQMMAAKEQEETAAVG